MRQSHLKFRLIILKSFLLNFIESDTNLTEDGKVKLRHFLYDTEYDLEKILGDN